MFILRLLTILLAFSASAFAELSPEVIRELESIDQEMSRVAVRGPADIALRDQAVLHLPSGQHFIPDATAAKLMRAYGNTPNSNLLGLIAPNENNDWTVILQYENSGYIKDDDAKEWNVEELFESLKKGTEAANERRRAKGIPGLHVIGWVEKPSYDAENHRLV
ncbi:MAG: DUF2167 domain-containing protein [Magnetococcales bacterium]|nr:DUF2167 domain-containing protein [Magnetococcales bacterium]